MNIKLKEDRILLKKFPQEEGAFFTEGKEQFKGTIMVIGPKVQDNQPGEVVYFEKYDHSEEVIEGEELILCREKNIICKVPV